MLRVLSATVGFPAISSHTLWPLERTGTMRRQIAAVTALGFVVVVGLAACEDKGPMQKAGEK